MCSLTAVSAGSSTLASPLPRYHQRSVLRSSNGTVHYFYADTAKVYHFYTQNNGRTFSTPVAVFGATAVKTDTALGFVALINPADDKIICIAPTAGAGLMYATYTTSWAASATLSETAVAAFDASINEDGDVVVVVEASSDSKPYWTRWTAFAGSWSAYALVSNKVLVAHALDIECDGREFHLFFGADTSVYYVGRLAGTVWNITTFGTMTVLGMNAMVISPGGPSYIAITRDGWTVEVYYYDTLNNTFTLMETIAASVLVAGMVRVIDSTRVYLLTAPYPITGVHYRYVDETGAWTDPVALATGSVNGIRVPHATDNIDFPVLYATGAGPSTLYADIVSTMKTEPADVLYSMLSTHYRYRRIPRKTGDGSAYDSRSPQFRFSSLGERISEFGGNDYISIQEVREDYRDVGLHMDEAELTSELEVVVETDGGGYAEPKGATPIVTSERRDHRRRMSAEVERILAMHAVLPYQDRYTVTIKAKEILDRDYAHYYGCSYRVILRSQKNRNDYTRSVQE